MKIQKIIGVLALCGVLVTGCGDTEEPTVAPENVLPTGGKFDSAISSRLEGLNDPVAQWLATRAEIDEDGIFFEALAFDIMLQIAEVNECSFESIRTFVISDELISGETAFPRLISSMCFGDTSKQDRIFFALSEANGIDVDDTVIEMYAWDPKEYRYNFYKIEYNEDDEQQIAITPTECMDCHLGPADMDQAGMRPVPIMNEIARPWSHWNSDPAFPSHNFSVPEETKRAEKYMSLSGNGWEGTGPELEQLMRSGIDRAQNGRMRDRRERPPTVETGMNLLRPLFCTERLNYVTEDHESNVVASAVVVDTSFKGLFTKVATDWGWNWYSAGTLRLHTDEPGEALDQIPARGEADVALETLLAGRGLTAEQILQVRTMDWKNPVFSEFRCNLWRNAQKRFETQPPVLDETQRLSKELPKLFEAIMQIEGRPAAEGEAAPALVSLLPTGADGKLLAIDDASEENVKNLLAAIEAGTLTEAQCGPLGEGFCLMGLSDLGGFLQAYIDSYELPGGRERLRTIRNSRACRAVACFGAVPAISDVAGCPETQDGENACPRN